MISSIDEFLTAHIENDAFRVSFDFGEDEYCFEDFRRSQKLAMDVELTRSLERIGVLYIYGGSLEINPMAIRVLERMKSDGKHLSEENVRHEIEMSRENYYAGHFDEEAELENA